MDQCEDKKMAHQLFDHLNSIRPTLLHWAVDLASKKDNRLDDVLKLTDTLNTTIIRYKQIQSLFVFEFGLLEFSNFKSNQSMSFKQDSYFFRKINFEEIFRKSPDVFFPVKKNTKQFIRPEYLAKFFKFPDDHSTFKQNLK